jgi:hypothetical protein
MNEAHRLFKPRKRWEPQPRRVTKRSSKAKMVALRTKMTTLVAKQKSLTNEIVVSALDVNTRAATRLLREFVAAKKLKLEGHGPSAVYTHP